MEYRRLGITGLKVSPLCLGTMQMGWTADEADSIQILNEAYEAGINFIDTADIYSRWAAGNSGGESELIIGKWLKQPGVARNYVILATKVRGKMGDHQNNEGLSRKHILAAVEKSLMRLQTDYIDLYQVHWPDDDTSLEETLSALDQLVRQGKVRYLGCSNFPAWQLVDAIRISTIHSLARFECIQPHYNLVHRAEFERELRSACVKFGIGVIPYSPLAGGFLSGKYRRNRSDAISARQSSASKYFSERNWALLDLLEGITAGYSQASISQIALSWLMADPIITSPIIGPRTIEQLRDNLGALELVLSEEEIIMLNKASDWR